MTLLKPFRILSTVGLLAIMPFQSHAAWFEATGQAIINNNNKQVARARATQEAIKQALLFAGASVSSVQEIANGLLKNDHLEIRASGEVSQIELIDEVYGNGFVTVSIRADIFPQESQCQASDYVKSIVTGHFKLKHRGQATIGGLYGIGPALASRFQKEFLGLSRYSEITKVEEFNLVPGQFEEVEQAIAFGNHTGAQFILIGEIDDISVEETGKFSIPLIGGKSRQRNLSLSYRLISATTGELLLEGNESAVAPWQYKIQQSVDPNSNQFWQSEYGEAINNLLADLTQKIDDTVSCIPAYGRIVNVNHSQLSIDLGKSRGVKRGDELNVFKMTQFYDPLGKAHFQYHIHPVKVRVTDVYHNSAVVSPVDDVFLANIQPNDFVVRF
jgi:hypothetical protein